MKSYCFIPCKISEKNLNGDDETLYELDGYGGIKSNSVVIMILNIKLCSYNKIKLN